MFVLKTNGLSYKVDILNKLGTTPATKIGDWLDKLLLKNNLDNVKDTLIIVLQQYNYNNAHPNTIEIQTHFNAEKWEEEEGEFLVDWSGFYDIDREDIFVEEKKAVKMAT